MPNPIIFCRLKYVCNNKLPSISYSPLRTYHLSVVQPDLLKPGRADDMWVGVWLDGWEKGREGRKEGRREEKKEGWRVLGGVVGVVGDGWRGR
jgi:hypothetical protein